MKKKLIRKRMIFFEMLLIICSVFIFRGLWTLLDQVPMMNATWFLWTSLIISIILSVFAFECLMRISK